MTFHKSSRYLDIQLQLQRRDKGRVNVGTLRTLLLLHPGPAVENEEKIVLGWNNAQCVMGVAQVGLPGSHEAVIMLSLGACQGV